MKNLLLYLTFIFFSLPICSQEENKYEIGDFAHGGIIIHVDETGNHGLVATINDLSKRAKWVKQKNARKNNRLSEEMFTTKTIFNKERKKSETTGDVSAFRLVKKHKNVSNGKTFKDWVLPSKDEMNLIFQNKDKINAALIKQGSEPFADDYYWTSSACDYSKSYVIYFKDGKQSCYFNNYAYRVRAVREF